MKKTVFVGLSGGVDSSVAALRLKNQGYNVVGVFIKVWQPDFINCSWEEERLDAMRIAAQLQIPFLTCDAEKVYKEQVADYFIAEYRAGRTPNPDVMCNKAVKFGVFYDFAMSKGANFVATGHYAQIEGAESGFSIKRGVDSNKDQSYFLWMVPKLQLANILFPVGNTTKNNIREEALQANLPVATKKDSQGICFLGLIDIPEFLAHFIDLEPGKVIDETGKVIGEHTGAEVYTVGQRHGFTVTTKHAEETSHYVIARNLPDNTITVSSTKPIVTASKTVFLTNFNCLIDNFTAYSEVEVQTRYRQTPLKAQIASVKNERVEIVINDAHEQPSPGQSCVLYDGDLLLGGGIIA